MKNIVKIVFVIIATLVGAGFASGKEIFTFFFVFGGNGILGIIISSMIISWVVYKVFRICGKCGVETYQEFCKCITKGDVGVKNKFVSVGDSKFARFLNNIVNIFLLITFYVMIAGFSSLLKQEFGVNGICGSFIIILLCYLVLLRDVNGLTKMSNYLVPILIVFIVCVSLKDVRMMDVSTKVLVDRSAFHGLIKCVLYACYNCIILVPVLIPLRKNVGNSRSSIFISIIGFILLIILSFSIFNLLLQGNMEIFNLDMPIIGIVKNYGTIYTIAYIIIIGISIFTSAISAGCGFLSNCSKNARAYKRNLIVICITAVFLSQISFSTMVNSLYPVLGIFGGLEVLLILCFRET